MEKNTMLFMGLVYPKDEIESIQKKSRNTMEVAQNELQWNLIEGLEKNLNNSIDIINRLPIYSFPKWYKECYIRHREFHHTEGADDSTLSFINIQIIKDIVLDYNIKKEIIKRLSGPEKCYNVSFAYTLDIRFLKGFRTIKKHSPSTVTCCIIADLPLMSSLDSRGKILHNFVAYIRNIRIKTLMKYVDRYVLLTDQMADYLHIDRPYCVVEGISKLENINVNEEAISKKNVVYTGTLHECFGIKRLVSAFMMIKDDDYRLTICGIGDSEEYLKEKAKLDKRIIFLGCVSHDKAVELQHTAGVLVNPRTSEGKFTKYSFPSKTMEYLATGRPLIAYKLEGIPDEYGNYINYIPDNTLYSLKETIIRVCEDSSGKYGLRAKLGRDFVQREKNAEAQTKKIIELINCH